MRIGRIWAVAALALVLQAQPAEQQRPITVTSINLAKTPATLADAEILNRSELRGADIYLLQEVSKPHGETQTAAHAMISLKRPYLAYRDSGRTDDDGVAGLAILSRFPLHNIERIGLKQFDLRFHSRSRFALAACAGSPAGPLQIYNVHLDTRLNPSERLKQLQAVLDHSWRACGPIVLGGDFNTNPNLWLARMIPIPFFVSQANRLREFMAARGFQSALNRSTHDFLGMQLDSIFSFKNEPGGGSEAIRRSGPPF